MPRDRRRLDVPLDHRAAHQLAPSGAGGAVAMMPEETVRPDSELPRHRGGQRGEIGGGIATHLPFELLLPRRLEDPPRESLGAEDQAA